MRVILIPLLLSVFACWLPVAQAQAQTEDEEILEESADQPPPEHRQSKRDDELDDEDLDAQVFYSGMAIERVKTDFENLGNATNIGGVLGFRVPTVPWVGLEIDIAQTIIPGEYRTPGSGGGGGGGCGFPVCPAAEQAKASAPDNQGDEFAMQALGIGLAFKSMGKFYFTGKYAYRYIATSNDTVNEDRSGNGFGAGVGYRWGRGLSGVELGYKQLAKHVDAVGLTFFVRAGAGR